jgi:hypothetical protein
MITINSCVILSKTVLFGPNHPNANVAQNVAEIKCSEDTIFVANDSQMTHKCSPIGDISPNMTTL